MTNKELKLVVLEAASILGRFNPMAYSEKYRARLMTQAWKLVKEGVLYWEILDDGSIIFCLV